MTGGIALNATGAYSSIEAGRAIGVSVADDRSALLAITTEGNDGATVGLLDTDDRFRAPQTVAIENRFGEPVTVELSSDDDVTFDTAGSVTFSIDPNETERIEVDTDERGDVDAELRITADGSSVSASLTRELKLESTSFDATDCREVIDEIERGGGRCDEP